MPVPDQPVCTCETYRSRDMAFGPMTEKRRPSPLCPVHGDPRDTSVDQTRPWGSAAAAPAPWELEGNPLPSRD